MSDGSKLLDELLSAGKQPEVAAVFDAVPGWHAVLIVKTGMSDPGDPDAKYGKEWVRVFTLPIKQWGVSCPPDFLRRPSASKEEESPALGAFASMFGGFLGAGREPAQTILPIDPREDSPKFFDLNALMGIYPPSEGGADDVFKKATDLMKEHTQKEIERKRARDTKVKAG